MSKEAQDIILKEVDEEYKNLGTDILTGKIPTLDDIKKRAYAVAERSVQQICVTGAGKTANEFLQKYGLWLAIGVALVVALIVFRK